MLNPANKPDIWETLTWGERIRLLAALPQQTTEKIADVQLFAAYHKTWGMLPKNVQEALWRQDWEIALRG